MSTVQVTDRRGGVYEVVVTFTYGECARLPFNSLRKVNARIDQIRNGGLKATAQFNLRNASESGSFVEMLDMFGEDGSFVHGSPADPEDLKRDVPDDDEDEPGIRQAAVVSPRPEALAVPSPQPTTAPAAQGRALTAAVESAEPASSEPDSNEVADLEIDEGFGLVADENWREKAAQAAAISLAEHENRAETLQRVQKVAGDRFDEQMVHDCLIQLLWEKFQDEAYVAAFLKRRGWQEVDEAKVRAVAAANA